MKANQALLNEMARIKANLLQNAHKNNSRSIFITCANNGEGASTVASNLAVSLALGDTNRVLLVDGNIHKPTLHQCFGHHRENGFSDFLQEKTSLADLIKPTTFRNMSLLTAGKPLSRTRSLEILSNIGLDRKKEMEKNFDWVIYDTPPVNTYPDTLLMAPLSDGVILVIFAEKTRPSVVQKAKVSLESINANILGGILNGRKHAVPDFIYKRL